MSVKIVSEESNTRVTITPEIAAQMLDSNTRNRPISWSKVRTWSSEMSVGNWRYNPADAVCFDSNGVLVNGQHRLLAVLDCEIPQEFLVSTGVEPDTQDVMDAGMKRNVGHQLAIHGYANAKDVATIGNTYIRWRNGKILSASGAVAPTTTDVRQWLDDADPNALDFATIQGKRVAKLYPVRMGPAGAAAFSAYNKDTGAAGQFFDDLCDGVGLDKGHPVLTLSKYLQRQAMLNVHLRVHHQLWLMVSTWNTWRSGKSIGKIMSPSAWDAEHFPKMK